MGIIKSNKTASKSVIKGEETFKVRIELESEPRIMTNPQDVVLILDHSGSMAREPMIGLRAGARHFLDVLDKSTDGITDDIIGRGSRVGIVGFDTVARIERSLSTDVRNLKSAVNQLVADGTTNHEDAFAKARQVLNVGGSNGKTMILFTDGNSDTGKEGFLEAEAAKAEGTTIYCIGLGDDKTLDMAALERWASPPAADHILVTPDFKEIEGLFDMLAVTVSEPKATGIMFTDTISPCFEVVSVDTPSTGSAAKLDSNNVQWSIPSLGAKEKETASLEFLVKHTGKCMGTVPVNVGYSYRDNENNIIDLPEPDVEIVDTTTVTVNEDCPTPLSVIAPGCEDYIRYDAGAVTLDNIGRILEVSTTIEKVCPNRQVALAVLVNEVDQNGVEYSRGMKTLVIPPHTNASCVDVKVDCIKFVLPEALDVQGSPTSMCNDRTFYVRFIANYIDTDYECCK